MHKSKILMLQDLFKKAFSMIFFVLLARYLTTEEFGQYQQLILIAGIFTIVFNAGVPTAVSYFYGQSKGYTQKISLLKRMFIFQLFILSVGSTVLLFFTENLTSALRNPYLDDYVLFVIVIFITNSLFEYFKNLSTVTNDLKFYLKITTLFQLVALLLSATFLVVYGDVLYVLALTSLFNLIIVFFLITKNLKYFKVFLRKISIQKIELKYIVAMGSVGLINVVNGYVDQIMVSTLLSVKEYAILKIGAFQIPFISIVTGSLLTVMIPIISKYFKEGNIELIVDTWRTSMEKATILLVPIVIFCLIFADNIIITFFGEKYDPAILVFQIYMIQWLRAVVIFGGVMGAVGLEKELFKNTIVVAGLNIILNYYMITLYGVIGAAITTTLLNYFGALLLIRKLDKHLCKDFFSYFPVKVYITSIILSLSIGVSLKFFIMPENNSSVLILIIFSFVYYVITLLSQMKLIYKNLSLHQVKSLL